MTTTTTTLYERLGGAEALRAAVPEFYKRVNGDPELSGYFKGLDMPHQIRMLTAFLGHAAGGPQEYRGRSLAEAHADLGITDRHFSRVITHLVATLRSLGVKRGVVRDARKLAESVRDQVLGR